MHRASMPSLHRSRLVAAGRPAAPDEDELRLCSVLLASVMSVMLLCGLLSLIFCRGDSDFHAIVAPGAIVLMLIFLGWLVTAGLQALAAWWQPQAPAPAPALRLCACGLSDAEGVAALPAFPFQPPPAQQQPAEASQSQSEGERQPPTRGSATLCAVCLEDVRAGEMVRQLPACRHLFHVDCVDVWLRSHRTCPLCRCELPRRQATTQAQQTVAALLAAPTTGAVLLPLPHV